MQFQYCIAGEFKDQAAFRVICDGELHKAFAVFLSRLLPIPGEDGIELQLRLTRFEFPDTGAECLLRARGAGGGEQLSLPVHQGNTVGGDRSAHPFQHFLFRIGHILFPAEDQPEFCAGQDVPFVYVAARKQFILAVFDDARNFLQILTHLLHTHCFEQTENREEHDDRDEQEGDH